MTNSIGILTNLDLLSVGVAVAGMAVLGFVVYFTNTRGHSQKVFLTLTLVAAVWGIFNYGAYQVSVDNSALWILRGVLFLGLWASFFTFLFTYLYPDKKLGQSSIFLKVLLGLTLVTSLLCFTPLMISGVIEFGEGRTIGRTANGVGMFIYAINSLLLNGGAIANVVSRLVKAGNGKKKPFIAILLGLFVMLSLIIVFNFILPAFFNDTRFIPLGAVFLLPFIVCTTYGIVRHKVFNIKIFAAGFSVFALSTVSIVEIIIAEDKLLIIYRIIVFIFILVFGILLLKSVSKEVKQREQIEVLASNLQKANERLKELDRLKSEFVSIASHQLRSPLTAMKGYASLILEGSFGQVNDSVKEAVQKIFDSSNLMAVSVQDFLDVSRIEQGKMKYNFEEFDIEKLAGTVVEELSTVATDKGLKLNYKVEEGGPYRVNADLGKIKQVIYNLVDNSIKYTPKGSVTVRLYKTESNKVKIEIEDTGVGISAEALPKLFAKFVRTRNAHHVNVSGTGLGLFVVKQMIEAHKGKVWVSSPGEGKGSTFHVELASF